MKVCKCINFGVKDIADRIINLFCVRRVMAEQLAETLCAKTQLAIKQRTNGKITWVASQGVAYADEITAHSTIMEIIEIELMKQLNKIAFGEEEKENAENH